MTCSRRSCRRLGGLDVLVNNVGVAGPTAAVDDMDPDDFDRCVQVNLGSMFRCTRKAVPLLRERPGSIVNISSTAGHLRLSAAVAVRRGEVGGCRVDQDLGDGARLVGRSASMPSAPVRSVARAWTV